MVCQGASRKHCQRLIPCGFERNIRDVWLSQTVGSVEPPALLLAQSEDELKTKEEPPASDAIGSGIAGKSSATVVVEVRILETPARYVV